MDESLYKLQSLAEYIIHKKKIEFLEKWINKWENGEKNEKKYIILSGPSGCGKSLLVHLLFKKHNYDLVEFMPSHNNTHKNEVKRLLQLLTATNILSMIGGNKKAVLFDDIEIGNSGDRGYLNDILAMFEGIEKKKIISNPAIFTISGGIKYKKVLAIEKHAVLVQLTSPTNYEIFQIAKYLSSKMSLGIEDHKLLFLSNGMQGDLRKLYHAFELHKFNDKLDENDSEVDNNVFPTINDNLSKNSKIYDETLVLNNEGCGVLYKKDLEFSPLNSIEQYINPDKEISITTYQRIFESEPMFTPANIYDNSWNVLKDVHYKDEEDRRIDYAKILNSICDWAIMENYYCDPNCYAAYEFRSCVGIAKPMDLLRKSRKTYAYSHVNLKTSNLFSRISQSSFNWKSISELSDRLNITRNQYHQFSYVISKMIANNNINLSDLGNYLLRQSINPGDLDRIIRYNCISNILEKEVPTKRKTIVRKILNGKSKSIQNDKPSKIEKTSKLNTKSKSKSKPNVNNVINRYSTGLLT